MSTKKNRNCAQTGCLQGFIRVSTPSRLASPLHYNLVLLPMHYPDTYAESYHRGFFANLAKGRLPEKCGAVTHDTASVGGLVTVAPIAIAELLRDRLLRRGAGCDTGFSYNKWIRWLVCAVTVYG